MKEPLRILHVVTTMNLGGLENFIMNLYRNIDRSKLQFDFLMHRPEESAFEKEIYQLGGKVFRLSALKPQSYFKYRAELRMFFRNHPEYNIIHSHINENSALVLRAAKNGGVPVRIAHSHISANADTYQFYRKILKSSIPNLSTHRFACSSSAGQWLFGAADFKLFNNSIDVNKFKFDEQKRWETRNLLGIEANGIILGNVSRFNLQKNHKFLIQIFSEYNKKHPASKLLLVGEGDLEDEIRDDLVQLNLTEKVIFAGVVQNTHDYLNAMDVYVFPSLFEGLPLALIEAQSNGLPIIMSDTISSEVILSDLVEINKLSDSAVVWSSAVQNNIMKFAGNDRNRYAQIIKDNGYDVAGTAKCVEKFYDEIAPQ